MTTRSKNGASTGTTPIKLAAMPEAIAAIKAPRPGDLPPLPAATPTVPDKDAEDTVEALMAELNDDNAVDTSLPTDEEVAIRRAMRMQLVRDFRAVKLSAQLNAKVENNAVAQQQFDHAKKVLQMIKLLDSGEEL